MRSDWKIKQLSDVCEIIKGRKPVLKPEPLEGDFPYLVARYMRGNEKAQYASSTDKNSVKVESSDTIIICDGSNSGEIFSGFEGILSSTMGKISKRPEVDDGYLRAFLKSTFEVFNGSKTGSAIPHLDKEALYRLKFPLPPILEQKRIVLIIDEIFNVINIAIANAEDNLSKAHSIFETCLNSFIADNNDGWVNAKLQDLIEITHGFAFDGSDFGISSDIDKAVVLTPGNYNEQAELNFTVKNTKRLFGTPPAAYMFNIGDLTIVMTDLSSKMKILGKPAFIKDQNILHNQRIGRIIKKNDLLSICYIYYFLRTNRVSQEIKRTSTGTMVRHTAPKRILSIDIAFPKGKAEQERITSLLDMLSHETLRLATIYQKKLNALSELKQTIFSKAFAGELTAQRADPSQEAAA